MHGFFHSLIVQKYVHIQVSFAKVSPQSNLPSIAISKFTATIDDDGSCLYRESADIHLDLDSFRYATDPAWKQKFDSLKSEHNQVFGKAIATLRKQHKLRQSDIIGLSERQVRRIEQGEGSTKVDTLKLFAKAHGMELDAYLDAVASAIASVPEEFNLASNSG